MADGRRLDRGDLHWRAAAQHRSVGLSFAASGCASYSFCLQSLDSPITVPTDESVQATMNDRLQVAEPRGRVVTSVTETANTSALELSGTVRRFLASSG
jgi:hypothetical protein